MPHHNAKELKELPLYSATEAARFLRLPASTVRAWCFGQKYHATNGQTRQFEPVVRVADRKRRGLSFVNLIELSVLAAIRRVHHVSLRQVRSALTYVQKQFPSGHPLADHAFQTNGVDLFVDKVGQIVNLSKDGQIEMKQMIRDYLRGVERNTEGVPIKLYLPGRTTNTQRDSVVVDPSRGFGRPVLDKVGVRTEVLIERFKAGESMRSLADDYALDFDVIEDIIRNEFPLAA